ncbi:MAG: hypothetical protein IT276_14160 [Ignavibacteriaceae bacterium]|nr:hypothetical protein [Ignavibacteriaceae bacterium]
MDLDLQYIIFSTMFSENISFNKKYRNPLRKDNLPNCSFSLHNDKIIFHDRASHLWGDCIKMLSLALDRDYMLVKDKIFTYLKMYKEKYNVSDISVNIPKLSNPTFTPTEIYYVENLEKNYSYFHEYHITTKTIEYYNIIDCSKAWSIKGRTVEIFKNVFVIQQEAKNCKIYAPFESKERKWRTNNLIPLGITQVNWDNITVENPLIITKGIKEIMIFNQLGFESIAPQSETQLIKDNRLLDLPKILIYDNDVAGIYFSKQHSEVYKCKNFMFEETNDGADYCKKYGLEKTFEKIKEWTQKIK